MKNNEKWAELNGLTLETDMLLKIMYDALKIRKNEDEIIDIIYLLEIIRQKFDKMKALF